MRILSIETSCDETSLALVECTGTAKRPSFKVLKHLIHSQIEMHREWGGVVPNIAKREHIANLPKLLNNLELRTKDLELVDAIAVTVGPGLEPALWAGITFAQQLAKDLKKPLLGANHMEGHMYSVLLNQQPGVITFPAIGLVVSGGHTILVKMDSYTKWKNLGETRDDAAGEAFDKVARLLKLPYPGGPEISKLALKGDPTAIDFPRPMLKDKNYEFSFSGIKTAVLYYLRDHSPFIKGSTRQQVGEGFQGANSKGKNPSPQAVPSLLKRENKADIAASFQQAVVDVLVKKTMRAAKEFGAQTVFVCGGVAANKELRRQLIAECEKWGIAFTAPANEYNTDNAAMIAAAAYLAVLRKEKYKFVADSSLTL
jgi:N6-L-threonylcarbamoyladenine synthase